MTNIVAAHFDDFGTAEAAIQSLSTAGIPASHVDQFYVNAAGQHAQFPIGGDQDADPEAQGAEKGALAGAAIGGAAGLALGLVATPFAGPVAAVGAMAAGAYAGSLAGAVNSLGNDHPRPASPLARPAGVVVAVYTPTAADRERSTAVFLRHRAESIEQADGTWSDGTWQDFDPVSIPNWRVSPVPRAVSGE